VRVRACVRACVLTATTLSVATLRRIEGGATLLSTGSHESCVGCTQPDTLHFEVGCGNVRMCLTETVHLRLRRTVGALNAGKTVTGCSQSTAEFDRLHVVDPASGKSKLQQQLQVSCTDPVDF